MDKCAFFTFITYLLLCLFIQIENIRFKKYVRYINHTTINLKRINKMFVKIKYAK